jgi:hypothetical protein
MANKTIGNKSKNTTTTETLRYGSVAWINKESTGRNADDICMIFAGC